ncbi:T9SS type A sorting domain-containing protein [Pedobacter sp. ASV28]|uniref:T9SS type A sorting domain-containing protein n=1 Tax=Pedobacter sp. ASV28 TaxID=2795123 RepID=UPI0018EE2AE1|nr:T9SS type A sorting domain-containing protein [Pedobacter sp. ASV28]
MRKFYLKTLGILCLSLFALNVSAQTTYYVKTDGTGAAATATSWGMASKDLQDVINTAQAGDKIFVARGTYVPNRPANTPHVIDVTNRDNAFVLKNGVNIYGGFAGTEANETQRIAGNETLLSGDLNGNDVDENSSNINSYMTLNKADNAYHVVLVLSITYPTIFDGFTVTKGDAAANTSSTLTVNSKTIDRRLGGGIYILESSDDLRISNVTVTINRANGDGDTLGGGGSGFYINNSSPTIDNCEITKSFNMNATPKTGGYNYGSGMSLVVSSNANITNTVFSENFGGYGGAVGIHTSSPTFTNCTFKLNRGNGRGGAVDIRVGFPTFTNCLFSENTATGNGGGAVYNYNGRVNFLNCIFYKNSTNATGSAYGSENNLNYGATFTNNTFYENRNTRAGAAANYCAGVHVSGVNSGTTYADKKTYVYNNIFFSNTFTVATSGTNTPDLYVANATTLLGGFDYNIIQHTEYLSAGQNNQANVNPLFISTTPGHIGFLAPQNTSPAKDAGNDSYNNSTIDFNGRIRKNGTIDIGAVEYHAVLPVSLISFMAKVITEGAQLNWKVGSETNNRQYIISRSTNGKHYEVLTKVKGISTNVTALSYSYTDKTVVRGTYYYKLEQEDLDGKVNYLATQAVKINLSANLNIYPNPTNGQATIAVTAGNYSKYSVIGLQGTTVLEGNISSTEQQVSINLVGLVAGTYIIKLTGANGNGFSRVIKL